MTIDIRIGKIKTKSFDEVLQEKISDTWDTFHNEDKISYVDFLEVEGCPPEDDGCTEEDTGWPHESYRSGATLAMYEFFREVLGNKLTECLRPRKTNDRQITLLSGYIKDINALEYNGTEPMHHKRLHWLKFWCNKAIELYGDKAAIEWT